MEVLKKCCGGKKAKKAVIKAAKGGYVKDPNDFRNQVQGVRRFFPEFTDPGKLKKVKFHVDEETGKKKYFIEDPQEGRLFITRDNDGRRVYYIDTFLEVLTHAHDRVYVTWDADGQKLHYVEDHDHGKVYIEQDVFGHPLLWVHDIHDDLAELVFLHLPEGEDLPHYFCHPIAVSDEVYFNSGFQRVGHFQIFWGLKGDKQFYVADEMENTTHMRRVIYDRYYEHWRFFRPADRDTTLYGTDPHSREHDDAEGSSAAASDDGPIDINDLFAGEATSHHPLRSQFEHQRTLASGSQLFPDAEEESKSDPDSAASYKVDAEQA
ncbi:unnamed protein product [Amoebophrya sp. A120]|nr:unnamed protein product [Amoebophrya sp. A120]|eukprot:GSA120T00000485001.1